jgi:hypothetical protein
MTLDMLISPHMTFDVLASTVPNTWKVISDDTNTSKVMREDSCLTKFSSAQDRTQIENVSVGSGKHHQNVK